jgi:hypothetical protein
MKNTNDASGFLGVVAGVVISLLVYFMGKAIEDTYFEAVEIQHKKFTVLCGAHGSTPFSYDPFDLTCENGVIIKHRTQPKE